MSKIVNMEAIEETETIDKFIEYMKIQADGLIDKEKPYWYNWALRQAFKAGIDYQKGGGGMAFNKTGLSTVISNVEVTPEVKAEIVEEKCDCTILEEKKEIATEE